MKKIILVLFVLLTSLTLAACAKNEGETIDFSQTFTQKSSIRVWIDDENGDYMEAVIAEFNKEYPNIVVEHEHMGSVDARELLKTFGPSGNGADVFQFPHDHLAQAILEDLVYPLPQTTRTLLEDRSHQLGLQIATLSHDEGANSFDPESANAVENLYAVPMSLESVGLYYNADLITTPATTFEELFEAADVWNAEIVDEEKGLTNAENGTFYLGTSSHWADSYFVQAIFSAFGFYPFGVKLDDPTEVGFANAIPALTWMEDELKPRTTGTGNHNIISGGSLFEDGEIPYVIAGPWNIEAFKEAGINFKIASMPTINVDGVDKETRTFAGAQMAAVYKYSDNKEDAIKFVEFLASDIAMELMYEYKGKLPALKADLLPDIEGVSEDIELVAMSQQLETSVPMPTIPQVTYYWGPGETMIVEVWNNGKTPTVAATAAEASYRVLAGLANN